MPLHVAIVGGGITGVMLAIGLRARGVACTVYERAAGYSEIGAGIGLSPNAERAMGLVAPAVLAAFEASRTRNGEDYFQWIDGRRTDEVYFRLYLGPDGFQGGRRSELLAAWAALLPDDGSVVRFGKHLVGLDDVAGQPVRLAFADGTHATADVVVGCDGVWSRVRALVFGHAYRATYAHQYCFRTVVPIDDARRAVGDYHASTRFMYNGPGAHAITYPVARGAMLNVLVVVGDPNPWAPLAHETGTEGDIGLVPAASTASTAASSAPSVSADSAAATRQTTGTGHRADAEAAFASWQPAARAVVSLLPPNPDRWAIFDMRAHPVPRYNRGRVVLAGDAAHATGPHLGAGAGMGIEDALALADLLSVVGAEPGAGESEIAAALAAFSDVRYARTQWIIEASRDAVDLFQWNKHDTLDGQDPDAFGRAITERFHEVWNYDLQAMLDDGRARYEKAVARS